MANERSVRVCISGIVQGVNFRAWTARQASQLGVSGWVRNLADGDVEAVFSGASEAVEALIAACHQGPTHAKVNKVEIVGESEPVSGPFQIRHDL
jgi:acylphosphatase